ncbi:MAG: ABC transporter permease [Candidatus Eisenbacteria bacterium]
MNGERRGAEFLRPPRNRFEEVWRHRYLLRSLVVRDLKVKYQRSSLGFVWTFLNPLLMAAILVAVFRIVIRIRIEHYWAFVLSGYFVWNTVQHIILAGSFILQEHGRLTRSVAFPKEILLFGAAVSRLVEFTAEIALILIVLAVAHHRSVPGSFALLPLLVMIQFLIAVGIMLPVATASILYRDVQHTLPLLVTSLFYLTPIFYPASMVPARFQPFYFLNPFAGLVTLFHQALYEGRFPSMALLAGTLAAGIVIFTLGYRVFLRYEDVCNELS